MSQAPALYTPTPTPAPAPVVTPTPTPTTASGTLTTSTTGPSSLTLAAISSTGNVGTVGFPLTNVVAHVAITDALTAPAGTPTVSAIHRLPASIGGGSIVPFAYFTLTSDVTIACPAPPSFSLSFPSGTVPVAANAYAAIYDPGNAAAGWTTISNAASASGNVLSWTTPAAPCPLVGARTYTVVLFTTSSTLTPLHLYVGNDHNPGVVEQFNLPLTSSSTPNFSIASNNVTALAVDPSGNLAVGNNAGQVSIFAAPLGASSSSTAGFADGGTNTGQLAFNGSGTLWVSTVGTTGVYSFAAPYMAAGTILTDPGFTEPIGIAFDGAQNLYIGNDNTGTALTCSAGAGKCSDIYVYAPPYTGTPIITPYVVSSAFRKIAVSATQLFVNDVAGAGGIDVYNLPITSSSAPAFTLTAGTSSPEAIAVDQLGNLYVGNLGTSSVVVYNAPVTASSTPAVTLSVGPAPFAIFGIAIGK